MVDVALKHISTWIYLGLLFSVISNWILAMFKYFKNYLEGFPSGAVVKNPPANAGNTGSSPGLGRSHMPQSN